MNSNIFETLILQMNFSFLFRSYFGLTNILLLKDAKTLNIRVGTFWLISRCKEKAIYWRSPKSQKETLVLARCGTPSVVLVLELRDLSIFDK
jgi:hypothetical protein